MKILWLRIKYWYRKNILKREYFIGKDLADPTRYDSDKNSVVLWEKRKDGRLHMIKHVLY